MKPKLVIIASVPLTILVTLRGQARFLSSYYDVTLVTSPGPLFDELALQEGVGVVEVNMTRALTPGDDLIAIARLAKLFKILRPDIVQTYTPKAGLTGQLAANIAGVSHRVHGIVGLKLMGAKGMRRSLLTQSEKLTYACATALTANSFGLRDWIYHHGLTRKKINVIGNGSINGVDTDYFRDDWTNDCKLALRNSLGIEEHHFLFVFVGRIVRDKGLLEMLQAFEMIAAQNHAVRLLIVGDEDQNLDPIADEARKILASHPRVICIGFSHDVRPYLAISDALILASYREGLPNCVIEACSMGLPCIVSDINGCNEIVIHGENGFVVPPKTVKPLAQSMATMSQSPELVARMRNSARDSVVRRFDQRLFWHELHQFYDSLLS